MENYDIKKLSNFITYFIINDVKFLGITKLMKLCFFADKYHLEEYGKPMLNKNYTKMEKGPVPMFAYSLIKDSIDMDIEDELGNDVQEFIKYISVKDRQKGDLSRFQNNQPFNGKFFSKSQMIVLERLVSEFKNINKNDISELSHDTAAWKSVGMHENISFSSMIDNNPELSKHVRDDEIEKIQFNSNVQRVLALANSK